MNKNNITQLELDFSVIQRGTKVKISGYDCHNWLDLTNCIGVVDSYYQPTGDYLVYFKDRPGIAEGTHLVLYYRRQQLEVIPGKRGQCSWEHLVKKINKDQKACKKTNNQQLHTSKTGAIS